ncbi:hypothetical protein [Candidatus Mycoplasma haematohominis]|uniref:hypothetical protein n=1 Tax=Candidatus Mycoplasma haematohominis TaxID=1494318 RepID=UPI001C0A7432|nr:hypothetical protein [Candidatus Mycoplasma haemohominis]
MKNYYIEIKNKPTLLARIQIIKECKNLYLKVPKSQLSYLDRINKPNICFLTIEIIENSKHLEKSVIQRIIDKWDPNRIIITFNQGINRQLLVDLTSINYQNISIDFYLNNNTSIKETIAELTNKYPNIKHFSVYPEEGIYLENELLGFSRYHHNMWSKDVKKYYAKYDFETIRDKQYIGIGENAVSREGYVFTKNNKEIELDRRYIDIQDHIDRLNYYLELNDEELKALFLLNIEKYKSDIKKYSVLEVHQKLISDFFET